MLLIVTECYRVLQSVTECYRVLQSVTECTKYYKVFLAHLLGPIFGLVFIGKCFLISVFVYRAIVLYNQHIVQWS